jgi:hypothetical protein
MYHPFVLQVLGVNQQTKLEVSEQSSQSPMSSIIKQLEQLIT